MTAIFVSHSGRDGLLARDLLDRLRAWGYAGVFLDLDEQDGIAAGRDWERELYAALRRSDAVVYLATDASMASRWCFGELVLARSQGLPVFALRATTQDPLGLLADIQWVDLPQASPVSVAPNGVGQGADAPAGDGSTRTDPAEAAYERLRSGMLRAGLDPDDSFAWNTMRSPYPGLRAFTAEDAAVFCGRDSETERLLDLLHPTVRLGGGRWVSVVGPSGSGKSSLLLAGVLPRLTRMSDRWIVLPPMVPGSRPVRRLAMSLTAGYDQVGLARDLAALERALAVPGEGAQVLVRAAQEIGDQAGPSASVLLCIDQAEEMITRCDVHSQRAFLEMLDGALSEGSPLRVACTLRSEFLGQTPERSGLTEAADDFMVLEPLGRSRLHEVIARPAHRAGLVFDPGLIGRMVEETTGGDALPLLGHTLYELAQRAGDSGRITVVDYEALGGVVGALQRRADRVLEELGRRGLGKQVLPTLVRLVTVDASGQFVRRRVDRAHLGEAELAVVDAFIDARLLTSDGDDSDFDVPAARQASGGPHRSTVEVAHEALLRQWSPLHDAIADAEMSLRLRAELERECAEWVAGHREPSYLLRGARLAQFVEWIEAHSTADDAPIELEPAAVEYLNASREASEAELRAERRANRRLRRLLTGVLVLLAATVVLGVIAMVLRGQAKDQQARAEANEAMAQEQAARALTRRLMAESYAVAPTQPDLALLLGVEAMEVAPDGRLQDDAAVSAFSALNRSFHVLEMFVNRGVPVWTADVSPGGELIAVGDDSGVVTIWDTETGRQRGPALTEHDAAVHAVAFSPNLKLLASAGADRLIRLWRVSDGRLLDALPGHQGKISGIAFGPGGQLLASASEDGTVRVWEVDTRQELKKLPGDGAEGFNGVAIDHRGERIAASGTKGSLWIWELDSAQPIAGPIEAHDRFASGIAFNAAGNLLATSGHDGRIRLWRPDSGTAEGKPLEVPTGGEITFLAFSPVETSLLASAGRDGTVRLWDVAARRARGAPLAGHVNAVRSVAFRPDGRQLASTSFDGTVRVWRVESATPDPQPLRIRKGHEIDGVQLSRDGDRLVSAAGDTVAIWNLGGPRPAVGPALKEPPKWLTAVALHPTGSLVATGDKVGKIRLRDADSTALVGDPRLAHDEEVRWLAFTADGGTLVSAGSDGTLRWWDAATLDPIGDPLDMDLDPDALTDITMTPDGDLVMAATKDGPIRAWDRASRTPGRPQLTGHNGWVHDLAVSTDGSMLASASGDGTVRVWDLESWAQRGLPLLGGSQEMKAAAFSPDGKHLAATGDDQTVRLWRLSTRPESDDQAGQPVGEPLSTGDDGGTAVAFGPRWTQLFSGGRDGLVRQWDLAREAVSRQACSKAGRNMTKQEWSRYVGAEHDYQRTCRQ